MFQLVNKICIQKNCVIKLTEKSRIVSDFKFRRGSAIRFNFNLALSNIIDTAYNLSRLLLMVVQYTKTSPT